MPKPVDRKSDDAKGNDQDRPNNLSVLLSMRQPELEKQNEEAEPKIKRVIDEKTAREVYVMQIYRGNKKQQQRWRQTNRGEVNDLNGAPAHGSNENKLSCGDWRRAENVIWRVQSSKMSLHDGRR